MAASSATASAREWPVPALLASQIAALGSRLGIDALELDADSGLALAIEDGPTLLITCPPQLSELLLRVSVGVLARHTDAAVLCDLLRFNRLDADMDGPLVGLSADDPPQLLIAQRLHWRRLPVPAFVAAVERFIAAAEDIDAMRREVGESFDRTPAAYLLKG